MNTALHFSSAKDDWQTPPELFAALDAEFHFACDVAASRLNSQCPRWFGLDSVFGDALALKDWRFDDAPRAYWCNPPYGRGLQAKFIAKAALERERGVTTVMLIPARTDTKAWHTYIWDGEQHQPRPGVEIRFLRGRITFVGAKHGAPFPSVIVIFRGASA